MDIRKSEDNVGSTLVSIIIIIFIIGMIFGLTVFCIWDFLH